MIDLMTHLFRLQAIVEEGSLRRAAMRLGITQPALSRSLAQIEERLGQPLVERHARGVVPTAFGAKVLSSVMRLARQWELAEEELRTGAPLLSGKLVIEAGPLWRLVALPRLIAPLQRAFADVTIEIHNLNAGRRIERLVEGEVDAIFGGLQFASDLPARLVTRPFTNFHDRVVSRAGHPLFARLGRDGMLPPEVLLDYPWLVYTGDPIYEIEIAHAAGERLGRAPDIALRCESLTGALCMLEQSDCITILPDVAVGSSIAPDVVAVPVDMGRRKAPSGVIFREEIADWPPFAMLLELCADHFRQDADRAAALP